MTERRSNAPSFLRPGTRKWWREVVDGWELSAHHIRLLTLACSRWDRAEQAREVLAVEGLTVPVKTGGVRAHPCVRIEHDSVIAFARLLRELDLDLEPPPSEAARPPQLRSIRRDHAS